jgi:exonuclease SbcC
LKQLEDEGKQKASRFRANKAELDDLTKQVADCDSKIAKVANADRERLTYSSSIAQLTERMNSVNGQEKEWETTGKKRLKEIEKTLESKKFAVETQSTLPNLDEAERALFELQEQENRLNQEVGAARQKVSVLGDLRTRKADLGAARGTLTVQVARHKTLERAFGKDGVPALLIEQALPEIESKANELLDRLSNGQMSIRFVTQAEYKDKKREDLKETLDIQISDPAGVRAYEMYSGGEAFRVNFAVRLALSEVLAQRKGARLQTLVIDEGFGSQDVLGRQRLIEAINLVKNDFAKILVITHLDELKDAFPTRIEVEKTDRGSTVQVI